MHQFTKRNAQIPSYSWTLGGMQKQAFLRIPLCIRSTFVRSYCRRVPLLAKAAGEAQAWWLTPDTHIDVTYLDLTKVTVLAPFATSKHTLCLNHWTFFELSTTVACKCGRILTSPAARPYRRSLVARLQHHAGWS